MHARSAGIDRALQQSFDVVAVGGDVVEVRPLQLARGRGAEQQVVDAEARVARHGGEPVQFVFFKCRSTACAVAVILGARRRSRRLRANLSL